MFDHDLSNVVLNVHRRGAEAGTLALLSGAIDTGDGAALEELANRIARLAPSSSAAFAVEEGD